MKTLMAMVVAASALAGFAGERIVHFDEMDHLAQRTAAFNPGAGVEEARYGCLMLRFTGEKGVTYHKSFFPISTAPKAKDWTIYFKFGFDSRDVDRAVGLRLYFGDPRKPESRLFTIAEAGSFFEGGAKPSAPKDGMPGFIDGWGEWNSAAITVSGNRATAWMMRGGKCVAEARGVFPAKPLIGWNLEALTEKTNFRFDRFIVTDGVARPWERGDLQEVIAEMKASSSRRGEDTASTRRGEDTASTRRGEDTASTRRGEGAASTGKWDAAFGSAMKNGEVMPVDLAKGAFEAEFRAPFRHGDKQVKPVGCAFELVCGEKAEKFAFGAGDIDGDAHYRVFKSGKFQGARTHAVVTNSVLKFTGSRLGFHTVPPIRHWGGYLEEETAELIASADVFPKLADRVFSFKVAETPNGLCRVTLNGQFVREFRPAAPVSGVKFTGDADAEARGRVIAGAPKKGPETLELKVPEGGFKLERVRENLGTFMLECNHYLSRDAYENMPSSCLWNVPRRQWGRAKALCKIDPSAPPEQIPVVTARLTHFFDNGGRSIAMCQKSVDLAKDASCVTKRGDLYEVTFDFNIADIMDLTSMTDGMAHAELPYLHFEFTGPVWDKNRYYIDAGRSPAEDVRSNVIVLGGSLEESPVWFRVTPERPYSLYNPGETPRVKVEARPLDGGEYSVEIAAVSKDADAGTEPLFTTRLAVGTGISTMVGLPATAGFGLYGVNYRVVDAKGASVQCYETSYGLIPPDTREAGYDSPYYSWNFNGAHGTPPKFDDWAPAYLALGVKRTLVSTKMPETGPQMSKYGFTLAEFPYIGVGADAKSQEKAKASMRNYVKAFPHCKQALVFHESGGGPYPKEIYGEKTELSDWALNHQSNRVAQATRTIQAWREVDPSVKMIIGNCGESYGLIAELMRGGLDKSLVDSWGEESVGLTMPPEMTTAFTPWCIKKLARHYGYTENMDCPWEWKCRTERYERSMRGAAAVNLRDDLIAHALGYKTIPVGCGTETANSYADTIWCSGTFTRWPMAYPRENALAIATETLVLDCAKYVRQLKTGSLTVYALEFAGKKGGWIYALWTSRGETKVSIGWENGAKVLGFIPWKPGYELVTMLGKRTGTDDLAVAVGDEPVYIVAGDRIASFEAAKTRTFRYEKPSDLASNRTVLPLKSADDVTLDFAEDCRIDPKLAPTPFRPGKFAARTVTDDEKGACLELEHLSQEKCPEVMQEYVFLKIRNPQTIEKPFDTIGIWAKGNSNWGRVSFEITDAEGEKWYSSGIGGVGCYVYDWPAKLAFNYDGWNFLQAPLTAKSDVKIIGPGENQWLWTRDGTGNAKIDWPVKVTAIGVSQYGRTLDLLKMEKCEPKIRLTGLAVR